MQFCGELIYFYQQRHSRRRQRVLSQILTVVKMEEKISNGERLLLAVIRK